MAPRHAVTTGNWSDTTNVWDGDHSVPVADDAVIIDTGVVVTVNVVRVPATSGTLLSLTGVGTGQVLVGTIGHPPGCELYATTITCGSSPSFINITSNGADHVVSIIATNIYGGSASTGRGIVISGAGTHNITGNITGGSDATTYGVSVTYAGSVVNILSSTLKGGSHISAYALACIIANTTITLSGASGTGCNVDNTGTASALHGVPVLWNPLPTNWTRFGANYLAAQLLDHQVLDTVVNGTVTGNIVLPAAADVKDGVFFGPASATEGSYAGGAGDFPDAGNVLHNDTTNGVTGTLYASNIGTALGAGSNLSAGILKDDEVVDDVTGTYTVGGGGGRPEIRGGNL